MATYSGNADSERCKRAIRNAHARRSRRFAIASVALIVVAGAPSGGAGLVKPTPSPAQTLALNCPSPALGGTLPTLVYLPAGYRTSTTHYPVVYFLHGLPANPTSYKDDGFVAAALATAKKPAIVVTPQGARSAHSDREYLDWSPTENWPRAISHDLVGCIDKRYRTIDSRAGRALVGLSAGGYGAFNIGLRQLAVFGAVESWSGYFAATNPAGTAVLDLGSPQANASAAVPTTAQLNAEIARDPSYIAFYVGAQDPHFLQDNENFNSTLTTAGIQHTFAIYPGGHSGVLWRGEASTWLANAIDYVAALRRDPRGTTGTTGARGATGAIGATGAT
jgi:enterochelin esterase-like enzyme